MSGAISDSVCRYLYATKEIRSAALTELKKKEGEATMGMMRIVSKRGDDRVQWNAQASLAGEAEAQAAEVSRFPLPWGTV